MPHCIFREKTGGASLYARSMEVASELWTERECALHPQ